MAEALTATACLKRLRLNLSEDVAKRKPRKKNTFIAGAQSGLDDEVSTAPKGLNVVLQLADASGSSGPPPELKLTDVPAWCTKLCVNRMNKLKSEKAKLEQKRLELQSEIQQKLDAKQAAAADLSEKKNEMAFVTTYIANVRKELRMRDAETAESIRRKKTAHLQDNAALGDEMRRTQSLRQAAMTDHSRFDTAELTRTNLEDAWRQAEAVRTVRDSIAVDRAAAGVQLRDKRAQNATAVKTMAEDELRRLQAINESAKRDQEVSAARLREKLERTRRERSDAYVRGRTVQFNAFKRAAAVTSAMQAQTAAMIEELRDTYDATRDLDRRLDRLATT